MRSTLFISDYDDAHSCAIQAALEARGGTAFILDPSQWLKERFRAVAEVGAETRALVLKVGNLEFDAQDFGFVWLRRLRPVEIPDGETVHAVERHSTEAFIDSLLRQLVANARSNVSIDQIRAIEDKLNQLRTAAEVGGWRTPSTFFSNDKDGVAAFLATQRSNVAKPLRHSVWRHDQNVRRIPVQPISENEIRGQQIQSLPMIYQRQVHGRRDVRVVMVGETPFARRIECERDCLDWKDADQSEMRSYAIHLPASVRNACSLFQGKMGSNYGVFDFLVDDDNQYQFLEYNLNGQFLFLDDSEKICGAIADDILNLG